MYDSDDRDDSPEDVLPMTVRPGLDVTSLNRPAAEKASRDCPHCGGGGFATIFDPDFDGSPIITWNDDDGDEHSRVARTVAYCVCAIGRWIIVNHSKTSKFVYAIIPDFADIKGRQSFWLDRDPTFRPSASSYVHPALKAAMKRIAERSEACPS